MIKGVFLDLYGTLIITGEATASGWLDEFHACLHRFGLSMSKQDFVRRCDGFFSNAEPRKRNDGLTVYERRIEALCAGLGLNIDTDGIKQTAASTIKAANNNCYLDPDGHEVLKALQKHKTLALISNFDHSPYIKTMLHEMDLEKYFATIVISEEAGIKKPDPAIFHLALRKTGLRADEVVHVGDSLTDDIGGAISVGIKPVYIQRNQAEQDSLIWGAFKDDYQAGNTKQMPEIKTIRRLTELIDIIE